MPNLYDLLEKSHAELTFEDVILQPRYSEVLPQQANIQTEIAPDFYLKTPLISAAMDTVTEADMAIAMALQGGLGIIHALFPIEDQVAEIKKVKRFQTGFILEPYTVSPEILINELAELIDVCGVRTFPVTKDGLPHGKLVGLITRRDYSREKHNRLKVEERMTPLDDLLTEQSGVSLERANEILVENKRGKLLIVDHEGNLNGMVARTDIEKNLEYPNACKDDNNRLRVGAAVSPVDSELDKRIQALIDEGVDIIDVESAHGHSEGVGYAVAHIRKEYNIPIMAGNVCTENGAEYLASQGAHAVKVGVGPGSTCSTRIVAGVGRPQLTAIADCARITENKDDVYIIADGGFTPSIPSSMGKAIAAGAHAIMSGRLFAGTIEVPGEIVNYQGRKWKLYRGMGSKAAREKARELLADRYMVTQSGTGKPKIEEGKEGLVPFVGSVKSVIEDLVGSLTLKMGYTGVANIEELRELRNKHCWVRVTESGRKEGRPHDLYTDTDIRRQI